jgi:hypothetical protein
LSTARLFPRDVALYFIDVAVCFVTETSVESALAQRAVAFALHLRAGRRRRFTDRGRIRFRPPASPHPRRERIPDRRLLGTSAGACRYARDSDDEERATMKTLFGSAAAELFVAQATSEIVEIIRQ